MNKDIFSPISHLRDPWKSTKTPKCPLCVDLPLSAKDNFAITDIWR